MVNNYPNNLPIALSSFVGRTHEVAEIQHLLAAHRLVTLTGVGGCGKTRLAIASAAHLVPAFAGRVWFVDLSALVEATLVPHAVAAALHICEDPGVSLTTTLVTTLAPHQTVLVLDNCEHLMDACIALIRTLLQHCPGVRILATSRETFDLAGEHVIVVRSLSFPPASWSADRSVTAPDLFAFDAIQLFVERAQAISPEFPTDLKTLMCVGDICRRLDGIPLAIELAAARVRTLSVAQIAVRLHDCMALLTDRHRTMAATLDWSYDLLTEPERILLRRVAIFARGWSLEAAEMVCTDERIPSQHVLDLVSSLVHKSFVVTRQHPDEVRYRLLEPVRQYAYTHMIHTGEQRMLHERHLAYFAGFIRRAAAHLTGAQQLAWFAQIAREIDNLRMALDQAIVVAEETGHPEAIRQALTLPAALERFWSARGHVREGSERLRRALAVPGACAPAVALARADALNAASIVAWLQGDYDESHQMVEAALAIGAATQDQPTCLIALRNRGTLAVLRRDLETGITLLERGLALERELGSCDPYSAAWMVAVRGSAAYLQGDDARARAAFEESITLFRAIGNVNFLALSLRRLGQLALRGHAPRQAYLLLRESLDLNDQIGNHAGIAACLAGLAGVHLAQGQPTDAARLLGCVHSLLTETAGQLMAVDREVFDTLCDRTRASLGDAFDRAWAEGLVVRGKPAIMELVSSAAHDSPAPVPPVRSTPDTLTAREREVTRLVAQGHSNREIARALTVEVKTVEAHLTRIFAKVGVTSRVQVAIWARHDDCDGHPPT